MGVPYQVLATSETPALVIYLLDVSVSMQQPLGRARRIDVVIDALYAALRRMIFASTKGSRVAPRYRMAVLAYSDDVEDVLGGIHPVTEVAARSRIALTPVGGTETARAFARARDLLVGELPRLQQAPAPLVCHMTDGEYTGEDPEPIIRQIQALTVPDGPVLVQNIFVTDRVLAEPLPDPAAWPGIGPNTPLAGPYADKLRRMSSPLPESYRLTMLEHGLHLAPGSLMLFPGTNPDLVTLGFQMSAATRVW